jgi:RND family efflux transporter MFP subunit
VVRAPYSGVVTERHVEVGELAKPGQPLMSGISLEHLRVLSHVPQFYVEAVRRLKQAQVYRLVDGAEQPVPVERLRVFPYAEPESHAFKVRAWLPQGVSGLYPGMLVKVGFVVGERERLVVPASAVVHRSELTAVYVLDEQGRLAFRQVRVGPRVGEHRVVLAGLEAGERVAVDPQAAAVAYKRQRAGH